MTQYDEQHLFILALEQLFNFNYTSNFERIIENPYKSSYINWMYNKTTRGQWELLKAEERCGELGWNHNRRIAQMFSLLK